MSSTLPPSPPPDPGPAPPSSDPGTPSTDPAAESAVAPTPADPGTSPPAAPAPEPDPEPEPEDRYSQALQRFSGDLRMARQVWQSMGQRGVERGPRHYRLYLEAHLAANELDAASSLLDEMTAQGIEGDAGVTWQIALAGARTGDAGALARLDELARTTPIPDRLLPRVLGVRVRSGNLGEARSLLHKMSRAGVVGAEADYRPLLDDVMERKAIRDAESFVTHLIAVGAGPSPQTATNLVEMMALAGHPDRGEQLLATLVDGGVDVDHRARAALVDGYVRQADLRHTRAAMDALAAAGGTVTSHHRNQVLAVVVDQGDLPRAWVEAIALSDDCIPTGANLESMMALALDRRNPTLAIAALDWMLMLGVPPPPSRVAALLAVLLRRKELDLALSLYRETIAAGLTPDRRRGSDLVEALVAAGRLDEAVKLLRQLRVSNTLTQGQHWGSLLTAHADRKDFETVSRLVTEMLGAKVLPTVSDASSLVGALTRANQLERARLLLSQLAEAGVTTDEPTHRELLWAFARKGQHEPAVAVHTSMVAAGIASDERHEKALAWASGETQRRLPDATPDTEEQAAEASVKSRLDATGSGSEPSHPHPEESASADPASSTSGPGQRPVSPGTHPDAPSEPPSPAPAQESTAPADPTASSSGAAPPVRTDASETPAPVPGAGAAPPQRSSTVGEIEAIGSDDPASREVAELDEAGAVDRQPAEALVKGQSEEEVLQPSQDQAEPPEAPAAAPGAGSPPAAEGMPDVGDADEHALPPTSSAGQESVDGEPAANEESAT